MKKNITQLSAYDQIKKLVSDKKNNNNTFSEKIIKILEGQKEKAPEGSISQIDELIAQQDKNIMAEIYVEMSNLYKKKSSFQDNPYVFEYIHYLKKELPNKLGIAPEVRDYNTFKENFEEVIWDRAVSKMTDNKKFLFYSWVYINTGMLQDSVLTRVENIIIRNMLEEVEKEQQVKNGNSIFLLLIKQILKTYELKYLLEPYIVKAEKNVPEIIELNKELRQKIIDIDLQRKENIELSKKSKDLEKEIKTLNEVVAEKQTQIDEVTNRKKFRERQFEQQILDIKESVKKHMEIEINQLEEITKEKEASERIVGKLNARIERLRNIIKF